MAEPLTFLTGNGDQQRALVVVFLRGGADGLHLVAPLGDDMYFRARPRIALERDAAVKLDDFYGMNPLLRGLEPAYRDGAMAIVHCAGSEDETRSHFEAQDLMEHGGFAAGGWLGRFLRNRPGAADAGPLSAVALGKTMPECLRGAPAAAVIESLEQFSLGRNLDPFTRELARLYGLESDELGAAAGSTLKAMKRIEQLHGAPYQPEHGADYGADDFSRGLLQIARMIKSRVGLSAASVDLGGWDSHISQGTSIEPLMQRLSLGLAAFYRDLGKATETTTVVVMTEFGRRVQENSSFGTDHGRGGVMFVIGGGVRGGRVLGPWPGLEAGVLEGPGDLPVANNYRNVLAPVLQRHGADEDLSRIFPKFELKPLGLYS